MCPVHIFGASEQQLGAVGIRDPRPCLEAGLQPSTVGKVPRGHKVQHVPAGLRRSIQRLLRLDLANEEQKLLRLLPFPSCKDIRRKDGRLQHGQDVLQKPVTESVPVLGVVWQFLVQRMRRRRRRR